jgi:hypothetical protein
MIMVSVPPERELSSLGADEAEAALLIEHGIIRVPAHGFNVDGYRYTNLADAVAQAKRTRRFSE